MKNIKWIALLSVLLGSGVQATSFDCAKAKAGVEKLICADETLSTLDDMLAEAYSEAETARDPSPDFFQSQRRWLTQRASCQTVKCLELRYEDRILQLRSQTECLLQLNTATCASVRPAKARLPRTADGKLMLLPSSQCRVGSFRGISTGSQAEAIQVHADCIEAAVYDPCHDAGGRWFDAQCAYAHEEVAQRRIRGAQKKIKEIFRGLRNEEAVHSALEGAQKDWASHRESNCRHRNLRHRAAEMRVAPDDGVLRAPPVDTFDDAEKYGYCVRRMAEERASKLEDWVRTLKASKASTEQARYLLTFLSSSASR